MRCQQRHQRDSERIKQLPGGPGAAIDQNDRLNDLDSLFVEDGDRIPHRGTGGNRIFDDNRPITGDDRADETTPGAVLFLTLPYAEGPKGRSDSTAVATAMGSAPMVIPPITSAVVSMTSNTQAATTLAP